MAGSNPSDAIVVPLRSKRQQKALAVQKLNHAIPAFGLLFAGQQAIAQGHDGIGFYLGLFELGSAFALIALTLRELGRAMRPAHHAHPTHHVHGIDWVDIAAGFVLVAEVLEHWHVTLGPRPEARPARCRRGGARPPRVAGGPAPATVE